MSFLFFDKWLNYWNLHITCFCCHKTRSMAWFSIIKRDRNKNYIMVNKTKCFQSLLHKWFKSHSIRKVPFNEGKRPIDEHNKFFFIIFSYFSISYKLKISIINILQSYLLKHCSRLLIRNCQSKFHHLLWAFQFIHLWLHFV